MATLRRCEHVHHDLDGEFEATHVLDNGPFLSHISLRPLDARAHMGRLENLGVQIGRCRKSRWSGKGCERAWAWKRGTATLDEMRCPACGEPLAQTTLALRKTFWLVPRDAVRVIATGTLSKRRQQAYERLEALEAEVPVEGGGSFFTAEGIEYRKRSEHATIAETTARLRKVQRNPRQKATSETGGRR